MLRSTVVSQREAGEGKASFCTARIPFCCTATHTDRVHICARPCPSLWWLQLCRQNVLGRWPYRNRQALRKLMEKVRVSVTAAYLHVAPRLAAMNLPNGFVNR